MPFMKVTDDSDDEDLDAINDHNRRVIAALVARNP
jgi:hypothetical protein